MKYIKTFNESSNEPRKIIIIKKGAQIGGYSSNGEHYVILHDDKWEFYTGYGKLLTSGKIANKKDVDYILALGK